MDLGKVTVILAFSTSLVQIFELFNVELRFYFIFGLGSLLSK